MRMKKERSWTREEGGTSAGLASGAKSDGQLWGLGGDAPAPQSQQNGILPGSQIHALRDT
jgi:hypothetical protein